MMLAGDLTWPAFFHHWFVASELTVVAQWPPQPLAVFPRSIIPIRVRHDSCIFHNNGIYVPSQSNSYAVRERLLDQKKRGYCMCL